MSNHLAEVQGAGMSAPPGVDGTLEGQAILADLLRSQPTGHSLLQPFYTSPSIYDLDIARVVLRHWHCVGHESAVRNPGDYFLFEIDRESVIVIRGRDNVVRALMNVCRHRGSRICDKPAGRVKGAALVCPYHAWTYNLDGSLRSARMMPDGFDAASHGLKQVALEIIEGLIFISLADRPLGLSQVESMIRATVSPYGWADAKVVHQASYSIRANWKLALENQVECYHCVPSHPDYARLHMNAHKGDEEEATGAPVRMTQGGIEIPTRDQWALKAVPGEEAVYCNVYSMADGVVTASEDGKPVAPLMGRFAAYDGRFAVFYVGPLNHFLAYTDYGAIFRYTPRSVFETELHVTWLVRNDARESTDYDLDRLTWLWRITAGADKKIVEDNQRGVVSRFYRPGPYAEPIEIRSRQFTEWYLREVAGPA